MTTPDNEEITLKGRIELPEVPTPGHTVEFKNKNPKIAKKDIYERRSFLVADYVQIDVWGIVRPYGPNVKATGETWDDGSKVLEAQETFGLVLDPMTQSDYLLYMELDKGDLL